MPSLAVMAAFLLCIPDTWAQASTATAAFPFFGADNDPNFLYTAFQYQWLFFSGFSGAGSIGVGALYYLAITATLVGAILIIINKKYQDFTTIGTWFILVMMMVFAPYNSKLLFYPLLKTAAPSGAVGTQVTAGNQCDPGNKDNICGFTPQVVAAHLASVIYTTIYDVMNSAGLQSAVKQAEIRSALDNDPNLKANQEWLNRVNDLAKCAPDNPYILPTNLQPKSDSSTNTPAATEADTPDTFGNVFKSIGSTFGSDNSLAPYAIGLPTTKPTAWSGQYNNQWTNYVNGLKVLYGNYAKGGSNMPGPTNVASGNVTEAVNDIITGMQAGSDGIPSNIGKVSSYVVAVPAGDAPINSGPAVDMRKELATSTDAGLAWRTQITNSGNPASIGFISSKIGSWGGEGSTLNKMPVLRVKFNADTGTGSTGSGQLTGKVQAANCKGRAADAFDDMFSQIAANTGSTAFAGISFNPLISKFKAAASPEAPLNPSAGAGKAWTADDICTPSGVGGVINGMVGSVSNPMGNGLCLTAAVSMGGNGLDQTVQNLVNFLNQNPGLSAADMGKKLVALVQKNTASGVAGGTSSNAINSASKAQGQQLKNINLLGSNSLGQAAGSVMSYLGQAVVAGLGYFFGGVMAVAIIQIMQTLIQVVLMAIIIVTPFMFLMGLAVPSNALGMLTVTTMGIFVLKFVPATITLIDFIIGTVRSAHWFSSNGFNQLTTDGIILLSAGYLFSKIISLTFWILFKMGDTNNLRSLTSIEDAASKIADAGLAAATTVAAVAGTAVVGFGAAAMGKGPGGMAALKNMAGDKAKSVAERMGVNMSAATRTGELTDDETSAKKAADDKMLADLPPEQADSLRNWLSQADNIPYDSDEIGEDGKPITTGDMLRRAYSDGDMKWDRTTGDWTIPDIAGEGMPKARVPVSEFLGNQTKASASASADLENDPMANFLEASGVASEYPTGAYAPNGQGSDTPPDGTDGSTGGPGVPPSPGTPPGTGPVVGGGTGNMAPVVNNSTTDARTAATTAQAATTQAGGSVTVQAGSANVESGRTTTPVQEAQRQREVERERQRLDGNAAEAEWFNKNWLERGLRGAWSGAVGAVAATGAVGNIPGIGQMFRVVGEIANEGTEAPIRAQAFWRAGRASGNSGFSGMSYWKAMRDQSALRMYNERSGVLAGAAAYNTLRDDGHLMSGWDNTTNTAIQMAARQKADYNKRARHEMDFGTMTADKYYIANMTTSLSPDAGVEFANFQYKRGSFDAQELNRVYDANGKAIPGKFEKGTLHTGMEGVYFMQKRAALEASVDTPMNLQKISSIHERKLWDRRENIKESEDYVRNIDTQIQAGSINASFKDTDEYKRKAIFANLTQEEAFVVDEMHHMKEEHLRNHREKAYIFIADKVAESKIRAVNASPDGLQAKMDAWQQDVARRKVEVSFAGRRANQIESDIALMNSMIRTSQDGRQLAIQKGVQKLRDARGEASELGRIIDRESYNRKSRMKAFAATRDGRDIARLKEMEDVSKESVRLTYARGITDLDPTLTVMANSRRITVENPLNVLTGVLAVQGFDAADIQQAEAQLINSGDTKLFRTFRSKDNTDMNAQAINKRALDEHLDKLSNKKIAEALKAHIKAEMGKAGRTGAGYNILKGDDGETFIALDRAPYDPTKDPANKNKDNDNGDEGA
ncbi:MAG TPA: hypothetical protein VHP58_05935 [Alphaproteobacteria bacterium]|nr:hypothetical protein [Alphaproteobacteria bacterium]